MTGTRIIGLATAAVLALAACQTTPAPTARAAETGAALDVRQAMVEGVNPAALAIWDVGNNAIDDQGMPDPAKFDAVTLARLREAAQMLGTYAEVLAEAPILRASGPDLVGGRVPEGVASRAQIQAAIDANPAGFRAYSQAMGDQAEGILAAIEAGDRAAVADRVQGFDGACQACHERYWYVSQ
jgi:cytochrome c556